MLFNSLAKMSIQGASTAAGLSLFGNLPTGATVGVMGQRVPVWAVGAAAGAVASAVSDGVHTIIHENIPTSKKFEENASLVSNALIAGGTLAGLLYAVNPDFLAVTGVARMALIGSGSEIAGNFVSSVIQDDYDY